MALSTGRAVHHIEVLVRMLLPVMIVSAFLYNTRESAAWHTWEAGCY